MSTKLKWTSALWALAPIAAFAGQSVDQSWDLSADASVFIDNVDGEIVVEAWDKKEARLTGELADSVERLLVEADADSLSIKVKNRSERYTDNSNLKLMIPTGANLEANGVSADVSVSGLDNERLSASSVSGDVTVQAVSAWVNVESVSGDVDFGGETSRISAESVSGDIDLTGISGEVTATTVSGDMELFAGTVENAKLETVSGDIEAVMAVADNGRLSAESMSGDVRITLPAGQQGVFKAQSFSGRITSDFGSVESERRGPGSYLKHVAGKGGPEIRVESFSGRISLQSK
jgi:DUF4097 and DUF4098 domain-containing protein YvlB